jgi:phage shock protein PspC (stress-responsive transcriptional regulator)
MIIGGVCGGIAEYFGLDPTLVRIITVLLMFLPGVGILTYVIGWIIIPKRPLGEEPPRREYPLSSWNRYLPGLILIGLGVILLMRQYYFWFDWGDFWPVALILAGLGLILFRRRRDVHSEAPGIDAQRVNGNNEGRPS